MKRNDFESLGLDKGTVDRILDQHNSEIRTVQKDYDIIRSERDSLASQMQEANAKLDGYDPNWKDRVTEIESQYQLELQERSYKEAVEKELAGVKFSSELAKQAFCNDLMSKKLPVENGSILGFGDYLSTRRESDPGAFASDKPVPKFTDRTPGTPGKLTDAELANEALRNAFK